MPEPGGSSSSRPRRRRRPASPRQPSGSDAARSQGRQGAPNRAGGSRAGGRSGSTSRRPPGSGAPGRRPPGSGGGHRARGPRTPRAVEDAAPASAVTPAQASILDTSGAGDRAALDVAAAHNNRRRARAIASFPGVIVFGVIALVLFGAGDPTAGLIAGAAAGFAVSAAYLFGARGLLLRALRARAVDEDDLPRAFNLVDGLCASMGLPLPEVFLIDDEARDALALGRGPRTAALVLTSGLVESLDPVPLEAVLAHELTHVKRGDIAPATVSAGVLLLLAVFVPSVGGFVHRLAGRGRELSADRSAVAVTRYPPGLSVALVQILSGPPPGSGSALGGLAGRTTRWLWTVALPAVGTQSGDHAHEWSSRSVPGAPVGASGTLETESPPSADPSASVLALDSAWLGTDEVVGELDAARVRIAALDEF